MFNSQTLCVLEYLCFFKVQNHVKNAFLKIILIIEYIFEYSNSMQNIVIINRLTYTLMVFLYSKVVKFVRFKNPCHFNT